MTRIDFYILGETGLAEAGSEGAVMTACKLCDKAVNTGQLVYINAPDQALAESLDQSLWTFRQGSFIGHERYDGEELEEPLPAVLIGDVEPPASHHAILINLGLEVPLYFSRFERVLEIVAGEPEQRAKSRERYKFYRDRGYELATHNL